jgi:hypothetical protein
MSLTRALYLTKYTLRSKQSKHYNWEMLQLGIPEKFLIEFQNNKEQAGAELCQANLKLFLSRPNIAR